MIKGRTGSENGQGDWYGTDSFQECYDLASKGWDAGLKMLESDSKINITGTVKVMHDVYGSIVDVGRYLSGAPDSMLSFVDEVNRNKPELTVYIDLAYHAGKTIEQAMDYTMYVINKINKIQVDYDVRLVGVYSLDCSNGVGNLFVVIKEIDQRFVLNSIAFSFHPAFFRRMWHVYLNSTYSIATGGGAGLRSKGQVLMEVGLYHSKNSRSSEYWVLPSLQHFSKENWVDDNITKSK